MHMNHESTRAVMPKRWVKIQNIMAMKIIVIITFCCFCACATGLIGVVPAQHVPAA